MHSIIKLLALSVFVAIALSGTSASFGTLVTKTSTTAVATTVSNGVLVVLTNAGWTIGSAIDPVGGSTTWSTVVASSGFTGVGLAGLAGCTTAITASASTLLGRAAGDCPSDFASVYTIAQPAGGTSTTTDTKLSPATVTAPVGTAVKWVVTAPGAVAATTAVGIVVTVGSGSPLTITTATSTSAAGATAAQQNAKSSYTFAFYVETLGTTGASVCFQTDAQHTNDVDCVEGDDTNASSVFSAAITGFVALIALVFFN